MSSSSADELPDIPGTRFPWMQDAASSAPSRSPRKTPKRLKVSAVEKERRTYKDPKKKTPIRMEISSDEDDFVNPKPGPSTSNRPRQLSAAEMKRQKANDRLKEWRSKRTEEKKLQDRKKAAQRDMERRANETQEERQQRNQVNAQQKAAARANETPEEHQQRNRANAQQTAAARANETPEARLQRNRANAERDAARRANYSPQRQLQERSAARERMAAVRKYSTAGFKDATRSHEILQGTFEVLRLEDTVDTIGKMDVKCDHCGALKFAKETSTTCCSGGKVILEPFPRPPNALMELWNGTDARSRLFRLHARTLNNAVCLSSLQGNDRNMPGFNPSVVFQGRVQHRAGALLPAEGEQPRFAQLYVYDAALESTLRFDNMQMQIPANTSAAQKDVLRQLLQVVQDTLHQVNPYIKDFVQIIEMPEEALGQGKIMRKMPKS